MLSFFKTNTPGVVVFYPLYLILFRAIFFFSDSQLPDAANFHEPLSHLLFGALAQTQLWNETGLSVLGGVVVFLQSLLVNKIVNDHKLTQRKNYAGGLIYILFASLFKDGLFLSPVMVAGTFLILATDRVFQLAKKEKMYGAVFDIGSLVSLAVLFFFPSAVLVVFAFVAISTLRTFNYREYAALLFGVSAPFFLVFVFYFWNDKASLLPMHLINHYQNGWLLGFPSAVISRIQLAILVFFTLVLLAVVPSLVYGSLIQIRKFTGMLILTAVLTLVGFFLQQTVSLSYPLLTAFPLSMFTVMLVMNMKQNMVGEVIHIILFSLVMAGQYLPLLINL